MSAVAHACICNLCEHVMTTGYYAAARPDMAPPSDDMAGRAKESYTCCCCCAYVARHRRAPARTCPQLHWTVSTPRCAPGASGLGLIAPWAASGAQSGSRRSAGWGKATIKLTLPLLCYLSCWAAGHADMHLEPSAAQDGSLLRSITCLAERQSMASSSIHFSSRPSEATSWAVGSLGPACTTPALT